MSKRNTLADNCFIEIPCYWVGYYLTDGSFAVVKGGTGFTSEQCELLAESLQRNYYHKLVAIDRTTFDGIKKKFNV